MKATTLKLNLGCGQDKRAGWINIDALASLQPDLVHDLRLPLPYDNDSVTEILAQDILEHFTKEEVNFVIGEIARVLKINGVLTIRVPNVDDILTRFQNDPEVHNQFLYGTTAETGYFGAHKVGFSPLLLTTLMLEYDLSLIKLTQETTNWLAVFRKLDKPAKLQHITYINQSLALGGAEEFMSDLLSELQNEGMTVKAYTTYSPFANLLQKKGITAQTLPVVLDVVGDWKGLVKAMLLWPWGIWQYQKILKNSPTDLLLFSGFNEKIIGSFLGKLWSIPVVWIEFGPLEQLLQKFGQLPKVLYYSVKKIPEKVIVPSKNTFNHLISGPHISLAKLVVIPCGRKSIPIGFSRKIKKPQTPYVVCVSRLEKGKGQDLLIKAFVQVKKRVPKAQLIIVGEGIFREELAELITDLKLSANVQLIGRVPNALTEMAKANLCVFPSMWSLEGFGLVLLEAMALGKPVIAFDHKPGNEIVVNEQTGLLAKSGDVKDLANKIITLLENPTLGKKLGMAGKKRFLKKYTIEKCAQQFHNTLNEGYIQSKAKKLLKDIV